MKKLSFFLMAMLISLVSFAAETTATLSFADKAQRTVFNSNQQVWTQNGITLTNDKAASTNAVADYAKPARFYAGSKLTVSCEGTIKQIVFDCNSSSYATTLKNSITSGATVTVSSDKVTAVPTTEASEFVVAKLTAQVRMDAITVTYAAEEENPDATIYTITATSADETMGTVAGAGEYAEGKTVTLTANANPGYEFVKWSNESTENPLIFEATENVTLTASFVAQTPITIAEANKLADGATCVLKEFVVTYVYKGYTHIQDESGATLLFKYDFGLKAGDKVTGLTASKSTYNGLAQLAPTCAVKDLTVVAGEAPAVPEVTTAPTGNYQTVVKLVNVKMAAGKFTTGSNATLVATCPDGTTINVFNGKNLTYEFTADKTYNITGGITQYSNKIQVSAYAVEEYVAPEPCTLATPVNWDAPITAEANTDQWYAVNVASAIAAGKDLALTVSNPGEEAVEITMEAYADCPATELIVKLTKTFNAGETKTTTVKYDEYLADQVEVVYMHVTTKGGEIKVEAEPEIEWMPMDLEIANLTTEVMEVEGAKYLLLQGRDDTNDADVMLFLNNYADVDDDYEVNAESSYMTFGGMELTVIDGVMTQTAETDKGTIYTGTVRASVEEEGETMYVEFTLTMYAAPATVLVLTDAIVAINEELGTLTFNVPTGEGEGYYAELAGYTAPGVHEGPQICLFMTPEAVAYTNYAETSVADGVITLKGEFVSPMGAKFDLTISGTLPVVEPEPVMETVYFVNAQGWTGTINAYAWEPVQNANWPGAPATKEAEQIAGYDVYSYTAEAGTYANVIFNNGSNQTADLKWTAGKYYVLDGWYTKEEAEAKLATPIEDEVVYFVNNMGWNNIKAYAWAPQNADWPGVAATKEAEQIAGYDVYSYAAAPGTYANVIFNGDGGQTKDLVWTAGKYCVNDIWMTKEEAEAKLTGSVTPPVITYVLMGIAGDWTTGIAMTQNADNANEYVLLGQEILEGDAVKVVTLTNGEQTAWCGNVDEWSVEYTTDDMGNIILAPGKYDFYYKVTEDIIYIGGEAYPEEPELEVMDIEMTNLVVQEREGFLVLTASDDDNTGLNVMLALNADGTLNTEVSYMALLQGWNEIELPIVEGEITKTFNEELATDVYTGLVVVEYMEGKLGLNLTMYSAPAAPAVEVVATDANIYYDEYGSLCLSANWNGETLNISGIEVSEEPSFMMIEEIFGEGEEDWYIWMSYAATTTLDGDLLTITGEFTNNFTGSTYNVTISGTMPSGDGTGLDNLDTTVAPAKLIENGQLIIIKNGVRYNTLGATVK